MTIPGEITTERLTLRPVTADDLPAIRPLWIDTAVRRHLGGPLPGRPEARSVGRVGHFAVVRANDGVVAGLALVEPGPDATFEVSCLFRPEHWGKGYGAEVVAAVADRLPRVFACTSAANLRAQRMLERAGMAEVDRFVVHGAELLRYEPVDRRRL